MTESKKIPEGVPEVLHPAFDNEGAMWVFGYGSLVWRPSYPFVDMVPVKVHKWLRRFYQGSPDHRGTPDRLGRVVTLVPSERQEDTVVGIAYKIAAEHVLEVIPHLDHREKGGYSQGTVPLSPFTPPATSELLSQLAASEFYQGPDAKAFAPGAPLSICPPAAMIYIGTEGNPSWEGHASDEVIGLRIFDSVGPSGPNIEYFERLHHAVKDLGIQDEHLDNLAAVVNKHKLQAADEAGELNQ